jgi:hypothetical protein
MPKYKNCLPTFKCILGHPVAFFDNFMWCLLFFQGGRVFFEKTNYQGKFKEKQKIGVYIKVGVRNLFWNLSLIQKLFD